MALGLFPSATGATGTVFSNGSSIGSTQVAYGDSAGKITGAAGLVLVGTPSATAPSTGTNGPGTVTGVVSQAADGSGTAITQVSFGNGVARNCTFLVYACGGTAAAPSASLTSDGAALAMRGHDGTNFSGSKGVISITAPADWSGTSTPTQINFSTTQIGATTAIQCGRFDNNQTLVLGGNFNSVNTFSAGTLRPHLQTASTTLSNAGIAQTMWNNGTTGPIGIFAKSRSGTVGTQGIITTGDTLGTLSWQGDDGTNFIEAARIRATCTGAIGTGQVSGRVTIDTMNAAATVKTGLTVTELQSVVLNNAAVATNATDGFLYIASCAGTPTGVPTANTGRVAVVYDTTNNKIAVYNGAWKQTAALT